MLDRMRVGEATTRLDYWLTSCSPTLIEGGARLTAPSLFGFLSLVMLDQFSAGRYPRLCENESCGKLFIPDGSPLTRYCKKRCLEAARKRRYRASVRSEKKMARARALLRRRR